MKFNKNLTRLELLKFCQSCNRAWAYSLQTGEKLQTVLFRAEIKNFYFH